MLLHLRDGDKKVPELLLEEKKNRDNYFPKVVSIGPYHHGKPELRVAEYFKPTALALFLSGDKEKEDYYYEEIKKEINNIKNCYEQDCTSSYSDDELVRMMLLDACFIIVYMETSCMEGHPQSKHEQMIARNAVVMIQTLGMLTMSTVARDMFLLENQIPLCIVELLLKSRDKGNQSNGLLNRYMSISIFGEFRNNRNVSDGYPKELHLLEAFHRLVVLGFANESKETCLSFLKSKFLCCCRAKEKAVGDSNTDIESGVSSRSKSRFRSCLNHPIIKSCRELFKRSSKANRAKGDLKKFIHSFRSVTDLKAHGIHFKPSQTLSLKDVKFESNCIYAKLQLPFWCVSIYTKVFFMNMIAYELRPANFNGAVVIAYINLMKSLIMKPEDVKELREKKILLCQLGTDKQILKVYQDINTYGADNPFIFEDVKNKIQEHYNSQRKTLIAEFIHTHFRTPWSIAASFGAICILVLTILQTVYTMKSYFKVFTLTTKESTINIHPIKYKAKEKNSLE
ncbi:hypothetical protein CDL12_10409 [Handroanthus impetiginosus]|uniref:Uncharacterized protein n=1 Tax=Handroanthus impetiginosus TaxID=429701 RepID=A0A2G9HHA2_9LAMI|nr:hypothetical protein CDL12_10409 [Handroanthus impetiginosus]